MDHFDVIIVGSGSSGGPLLDRLSQDPARRVLLIEAGIDFPNEAELLPGFAFRGAPGAPIPALDWGYWSEPLENGRRIYLRRGRLVGGSSMINGCIAVRAKPQDFDTWVAMGAEGWGWDDVRPYFERVEATMPLKTYPREVWQPIHRLFEEAMLAAGDRPVADVNAPDAWDGIVGNWTHNIANQVRQGTLVNYVRRARARPNVTILSEALVDVVTFDGDRATGVAYLDAEGRRREVGADSVFLCAGAYGSPMILMRSGIGRPDALVRHGVRARADLPVGERMMDHPIGMIRIGVPPPMADMTGPITAAMARRDGWLTWATSHDESRGISSVSISLAWNNPKGTLTLASADPKAAPIIDHGFQDTIDEGLFEEPFAAMMGVIEGPAFRRAGVTALDAGLTLRETLLQNLRSHHHPAGGCCIGSVVAPDLSVMGTRGLYVADASVFPINASNNPNLTCFMVGERAADIFLTSR